MSAENTIYFDIRPNYPQGFFLYTAWTVFNLANMQALGVHQWDVRLSTFGDFLFVSNAMSSVMEASDLDARGNTCCQVAIHWFFFSESQL